MMRKNNYRNDKKVVVADKKKNKVELKATKTIILKTFKVSSESLLLEFLYAKITNESRNNIKKYLSNHQVLVNGTCVTQFNYTIYKEDLVQISKNPVNKVAKENVKLDFIYEDDELIAIIKPSGVLSIKKSSIVCSNLIAFGNSNSFSNFISERNPTTKNLFLD